MIRVGVLGHGFLNWGGGVDFLRMVTASLREAAGSEVELFVLLPTRGPRLATRETLRRGYRGVKALLGRGTAPVSQVDVQHFVELAESIPGGMMLCPIDIGHRATAAASRRLGLQVLLPAIAPLPAGFPVPWLGYVYDFQHRYFPQLFSAADRTHRDLTFAAMVAAARGVIVNARSVAEDLARFHPDATARVFALPFSAAPDPAWLDTSASVPARARMAARYFVVCNQFWQHKDHATAFAAFSRIAASHPDIDLVCTGSTVDYRNTGHTDDLRSALARDGISERVHILGMVPKAEQIALLRGAIALVQPTLFEGGPGGGAVYDAVSLGVRCIVSDIPVNREIDESGVTFFPARNAEALAEAMAAAASGPMGPKPEAAALISRGRARRRHCGEVLLGAIEHVQFAHARRVGG